jgi:hypothetical protein
LRAVVLGTVPVKTGALLLDGCRLAHTMQMEKQKAANLERSRRRREAREEEMAQQEQETEDRRQEAEAESPESGSPEPVLSERRPEGDTSRTDRALRSVPCEDPQYEEIREGILAAQAEPLNERMEEELAVATR